LKKRPFTVFVQIPNYQIPGIRAEYAKEKNQLWFLPHVFHTEFLTVAFLHCRWYLNKGLTGLIVEIDFFFLHYTCIMTSKGHGMAEKPSYEDLERRIQELEKTESERKRADEALIESEKRYRTILNEMSEGYQEVDLAGNFTFFNEAFLNLFGYTREEMTGTHYSCYAAEESIAEQVYQTYNEMYKTGKPLQKSEWDIIRKDGQRRTLEYYAAVIKDARNIPTGFRGIVRDITEIRQAEADQENLRAQLTQAQKMESIGRLAGGVAHDFNNMLSVIMGTAQLARMKMDASDPRYADFKQIEQVARRSTEITRKLLAFARKQTIAPRQLDLNATVESMLNMLRRLIGEDIDLVWKPAPHLWPVKMDPSQIDQILANLCVNARDAIDGVGRLTIETGSKTFDGKYCKHHAGFTPGNFVLLAVSDSGCGMDRDILDNLFDPFFTTKEAGKGTGLGLATVYGIVKQNNGFINVYSEPGQGSTFKIYLPRLVADEDVYKAVPAKKAAAGGTETILLVEDEPSILSPLILKILTKK